MRRLSIWGARIALFLALAAPTEGGIAASLQIGVAGPLSGPDAIFGVQLRQGVQLGIADANAAGGILGQKVEVIARDDGGDPKKGEDVAKAFVAAKTPIVIGHFSSAVTVPASAIYAEAGIVDITPAATSPLVTERGLATVFRTCGRDDQQAEVAARYLAQHFAKIAILHDRTNEGKSLADAVRAAIGAAGRTDVYYGAFEKGSHDATALVGRLKSSGAQAVFWGGAGAEGGIVAKQIHDASAKITFMGGMATASDDFSGNAGAAADGSLIVFPEDPRSRPAAAALLKRLQADGKDPDSYVFYAYAAVQVIWQAADTAKSLDPKKIAETMHSGATFKTVLGDITFDAKGDVKPTDLTIYVWHKGATGRMVFDDLAKS